MIIAQCIHSTLYNYVDIYEFNTYKMYKGIIFLFIQKI